MYYLVIGLTFFLIYLIVYQKEFIMRHRRWIEVLAISGLLYSQYMRYIATALRGSFSIAKHLPFYPCRLTPFILLLYLVWRNKNLESILFFLAAMGLGGVLAPGGNFGRIDISFIYVYDHILYSLIPFYMVHHMGYVPSFRKIVVPLTFLSLISLLFVFINPLIDADYFYVTGREMMRSDVLKYLLQHVPGDSRTFMLFFIEVIIYAAIMSCALGIYQLFKKDEEAIPQAIYEK